MVTYIQCSICKANIYLGFMFVQRIALTGCHWASCSGVFGHDEFGLRRTVACHCCMLPRIELIVDDETMTEMDRWEYYKRCCMESNDPVYHIRCRRRLPVTKTKSARNKAEVSP